MSVETIDLVRDTTMQQIAKSVAAIAANTGGYNISSFKDVQAIVRAGLAPHFFHIGDQIIAEKESSITATVGNTEGETPGISAAAVTAETFIAAIGVVHSADYEFVYDGAEWHFNGEAIQLSTYGIAVTGTPIHGDAVIVHETAAKLVWDVIGIDEETPTDTQFTHSLTLGLHDCFTELQYDNREALFAFPNGLAAGEYHFTISAQPWYAGDVGKTVSFTLASAIPAGGQLVVNNGYNATMIGSSISSYANGSAATAIETTSIAESSSGTDLGSVTNALSDDGNTNSIQRALLGSNNWVESAMRQYLNSAAAAGSVWTPQTKFDRPPAWVANTPGFLNNVDPEFVSVLGRVNKITALNTVTDGGSKETKPEKVFLLSRSEVYAGDEVTGGEGAPYSYYKSYSDLNAPGTGADENRIKYRNGAAKYWWLRSPYASYAYVVRGVYPSGTLSNHYAANTSGVAPACVIV